NVDTLPEGEGTEQAGAGVGSELLDEQAGGVVALTQDRILEALPGGLARLARGSHRREQAQGAPPSGVDEFGQLVQRGLRDPLASGCGEMFGDVEDAVALVVERGS